MSHWQRIVHHFTGWRAWSLVMAASVVTLLLGCSAQPVAAMTLTGRVTPTDGSNSSPMPLTEQAPISGSGYWLVGADGGVFVFGGAQFYGSTGNIHLQRGVVGITATSDRHGYWLVGSDGGVFAFGDARFYGSIPGLGIAPPQTPGAAHELNAPVVGIVPSLDGRGYFLVAQDGGVFAFGDAKFEGSCPGLANCSGAAVAVMPDFSGNGYWLVNSTGNVYAFGNAPTYGSLGFDGVPVTSAVRTTDGGGYYILYAYGSVALYGDARNFGSPSGSIGPANPATAIFTTGDGGGYWVALALGGVLAYGDATNHGSMAGSHLNEPIIAATGW